MFQECSLGEVVSWWEGGWKGKECSWNVLGPEECREEYSTNVLWREEGWGKFEKILGMFFAGRQALVRCQKDPIFF